MFWALFKYSLFPSIMPRINALVFSGFANLAVFMAATYRAVKLLPENHAYFAPHMHGFKEY